MYTGDLPDAQELQTRRLRLHSALLLLDPPYRLCQRGNLTEMTVAFRVTFGSLRLHEELEELEELDGG